jgi:hypothetical protein
MLFAGFSTEIAKKKHPKVLNLLDRLGGSALTTSQTA